MKHLPVFTLLFCFFAIPFACFSQTWKQSHKFQEGVLGLSILEETEPGFEGVVLAGTIKNSDPQNTFDIIVYKTDLTGSIIWVKTFDSGSEERCLDISVAPGGYILTGYYTSPSSTNNEVLLLNIDKNGNTIFETTFHPSVDYHAEGINVIYSEEGSEPGFVVTGFENRAFLERSPKKAIIFKTDLSGNLLWNTILETPTSDPNITYNIGKNVTEVSGVGYYITGVSNAIKGSSTERGILSLMVDFSGNLLWHNSYYSKFSNNDESGASSIVSPTGSIFTLSNSEYYHTFLLTEIDPMTGLILNQYDFLKPANSGEIIGMHLHEDRTSNEYIISGYVINNDVNECDIAIQNSEPFLARFDPVTGNITSMMKYPIPSSQYFLEGGFFSTTYVGNSDNNFSPEISLSLTTGEILIVGYRKQQNGNDFYPELIKVDASLSSNCAKTPVSPTIEPPVRDNYTTITATTDLVQSSISTNTVNIPFASMNCCDCNWPLWAGDNSITGHDQVPFAMVEKNDFIYVMGKFYNNTWFDNINLNGGVNKNYYFVAKYNKCGSVIWAKMIDVGTIYNKPENRGGITVDNLGNVYVACNFEGTAIVGSFPPMSSPIYYDILLVKYDANGNEIWAFNEGGIANDFAADIDVDNLNNLYITGSFSGASATFGSTFPVPIVKTNSGVVDIFLAQYNSITGSPNWVTSCGGAGWDEGFGLSTDKTTGDSYVTGFFTGNATFGILQAPLTFGGKDIFLCKFNNLGIPLWVVSGGSSSFDQGIEVSFNGTDVFFTGLYHNGSAQFISSASNISIPSIGQTDVFTAKCNASTGDYLWVNAAGGTEKDSCFDISATPSGITYITGHFYSPTFSAGVVPNNWTGVNSSSCTDIFNISYNNLGILNNGWCNTLGGINSTAPGKHDDIGGAVFYSSNHNTVYLAGTYKGIPTGPLVSLPNSSTNGNLFLARIEPTTGNYFKLQQESVGNEVAETNHPYFIIYPNPAKNLLTLSTDTRLSEFIITNLQGQVVLSMSHLDEGKLNINVSHLPSGCYFYRGASNKEHFSGKIVIQ